METSTSSILVQLRHAAAIYAMLARSHLQGEELVAGYLHGRKQLDAEVRREIATLAFQVLRCSVTARYCRTEVDETPAEFGGERNHASRKLRQRLTDQDARIDVAFVRLLGKRLATLGACAGGCADVDMMPMLEALRFEDPPRSRRVLAAMIDRCARLDAEAAAIVASGTPAAELNFQQKESLAARSGVAPWIFESWLAGGRAVAECVALGLALMQPAKVCVRVNLRMRAADDVRTALAAQGIASHHGRLVPACLVLDGRPRLEVIEPFRAGAMEVQDEGSQLIACALAPEPAWRVLDACAGVGGKSLHIADLQGDAGDILAADIEWNKLRELRMRAANCDARSIRTVALGRHADAAGIADALRDAANAGPGAAADFDAVLVDAPCSAIGVARRSPLAKLRLTQQMLQKLAMRQFEILNRYARFVRPGGVLVYSTCSVMPQENEQMVAQFLAANPDFRPDPLAPAFARNGIAVPTVRDGDWHCALTPDTHGTDGFFIARMRRKQ